MNDKPWNDKGLSDALGAVVLISVVALGITVASVALLSSPMPDRIPALNVDVFNTSDTVFIRHDGGDTLIRGEYRILADYRDRTSEFQSGGTVPAQWSVGDTLEYHVPSIDEMPNSIQIVAITGNSEQVIFQVQLQPPTIGPTPPISPTTSTTTTVPPPVANFYANPLSGASPLQVQFTDTSTNSPVSWSWDFGDGGSTIQSPLFTYTSAGTYTVTLTATNAGGSNTVTKTNYITVNPPAPVASFTGTPLSGIAPLPVTFTDTSTNDPTVWNWSFRNITPGNNTVVGFSTLQDPMMTFGAGNFSIVLNASNSGGFNTSSQVTFVNVSRVSGPYSYYRDISVTNSPAIANYQMIVTVPYDAHMKTDFGDIRFMGTDGTTSYDYWIEKKTDGTSAVFWVNVPTPSTTTFRMYYGNSSLTTTSDGTKTFEFFDDFSGNLNKWVVEKSIGVYPRIESGYLAAGGGVSTGTYGHTSLGSSPVYNDFQDGVIEFKHQNSVDGICEIVVRGNFGLNRGYKGRWDARLPGVEELFYRPPYTSAGWTGIPGGVPTPTVTRWVTAGPWHEGKLVVHGNVMELSDDGIYKGLVTDNTYASAGEIALQNHYGSYTNFDDFRVRKYAAPEPTTSIGIEITV
jgi:PKD repeat protein